VVFKKGHLSYFKKHTKESIEKMKKIHKENPSLGMLGKKHSEETKIKIGQSKKGNKYFFGKNHTEEAKQKIREANLREKHHNWTGDDGTYHAKHLWFLRNWTKTGICQICYQKRKTGFHNKDRRYSRNREDYIELCYKCHYKEEQKCKI